MSLFTLQFSLQRQSSDLGLMASHSRLLLPFLLFLTSLVFTSSVSDSQFFTWLSQTLTISHSIKSKPFLQIQSTNPSHLQCRYPLPSLPLMPRAPAVVHSSLHSYRRCLVLTPCTLHWVSKVIFLYFSSFFFVSLVGFICYGNQMLKSNKPKDSYYGTLTKKT